MSRTSIKMLSNTGREIDFTGDPVRASGWYGYGNGIHTVAVYPSNFTGRFFLEASLVTEPTENDWFQVDLDGSKYLDLPYVRVYDNGETKVLGFTFKGKYLWLRARIQRSHLIPNFADTMEISRYGNIDRVLLSF